MARLAFALVLSLAVSGIVRHACGAVPETMYVHSQTARLLEAPNLSSALVVEVQRGDRVTVLSHEGRWLKVRHGSRDAYLWDALARPTEPRAVLEKIMQQEASPRRRLPVMTTAIAGTRGLTQEKAARFSRERVLTTAVAGTRGLTEEERKRISAEETADYHALEVMESFGIKPETLKQFMGTFEP